MSVPAYPGYKDSGVPWLGNVPSHWSLEPLRGQFIEHKDKNEGAEDQNYLSLVAGRGVMPYAEKGDMGNKKPDDLEKCKMVKSGNFVINSMNFGIGAFGVSAYDGVCSPVYVVLEPSEPKSLRFLRWIFDNPGFREVAQSFGNGILAHRAAIGWDELKAMWIGVPPLAEQAAIAAFLDRETAKIDALVAEQERLIALLKEKRQAVISHAVTKGLNPHAPMKDSGIEWLGNVPAHWEVVQQRRLINRIEQGWSPQAHDRKPEPGEVSVLRLSAIRGGNFRAVERKALPELEKDDLAALPVIEEGDFLLTRANTPELVGDCAIADDVEHTIFSDLIYRLTFEPQLHKRFALFAMLAAPTRGQVQCDARGTSMTMAKISHGHIKSWWLALPPSNEQIEIASFLEARERRLSSALDSVGEAIRVLQERRAALISAAVTGKIDVRGLVDTPAAAELEAI